MSRILVVDDHSIVRDGLALLLERVEGLKVVGSVDNGEEAVEAARQLMPDVTLMDLVLPTLNGIEATRRIVKEQPQARVVVLSASKSAEHVYRALRAGACGYVLKSAVAAELVVAIQEAMAGRQFVSSAIDGVFVGGVAADSMPKSGFESLSIRERDVLKGIASGSTSAQIGKALCLSPKTIDSYRARIMVKLGVSSRGELIQLSLKHELPNV
jgi:DNA-binding NarL/FixJ family response regulator